MKKTLSLLLALAILLTNMFLVNNNRATAAEAGVISKIDVTGVVEPKVGEKIQTQGIEVKAEGGSVKFKNATWAKKEGSKWNSVGEDQTTFREGEEYRITILVDPSNGSKFSNSPEAFVNGKKTEDALILGDGVFITKNYDKLPEVKPTEKAQKDTPSGDAEPKAPKIVKEVKISGVVAPKAGQAPKKDNISVEAVGGTVELKKSNWLVKDGNNWRSMNNSENVFEAGKEYAVRILVDPMNGSKFISPVNAFVNDKEADEVLDIAGGLLIEKRYAKLEDPSVVKTHKISYDLNGGKLNGKTGIVTIEAKEGETITIPQAPEREGYKFTYWKGSKYNPGDKYVVKGQHTFTAQWEAVKSEEKPEKPNVDPKKPQTPKVKPEKPNMDNKQGQSGEQKNNNQKPQIKSQTMKPQGQNNIKNMAPKTGDQVNMILSISLIGLAGAGLLLIMKKKATR